MLLQFAMCFYYYRISGSIAFVSAVRLSTPHPRAILPSGTQITGTTNPNFPSVRQFLGIAYAEPPLGSLRWESPQPPHNAPLSINAASLGSSCKQPFLTTPPTVFTEDVSEFNIKDANATTEDCLTLSIWAPEAAPSLPVIVFLYGGGWYSWGQRVPYQNPTQWVERAKDLIVVVPKYVSLSTDSLFKIISSCGSSFRGNIFGFPNARGATHQNLGILDQRLAYVHRILCRHDPC